MATSAMSAIKKGCALYREFKSTGAEVHDVVQDIGKSLGGFFKAQEQLKQVVDTEKRKSAKVHSPDANLNQQALDRVLAEGRMYQMEVELRELLIYQSPPELGDLYTRFNKMRQTIQQEQEQARREQDRKERTAQAKRQKMIDTIQEDIIYVFVVLFVCLVMAFTFWLIVEERKIRWGF